MFWFEKQHPNVVYADIRNEDHTLCDGRELHVNPDVIMDFTNMSFPDKSFKLVIFDPPHLKQLGSTSWMALKYGKLFPGWEDVIQGGFSECYRVLDDFGVLIFKWNESQIKLSEIEPLYPCKPIVGHTTGRQAKTIWVTFMKIPNTQNQ